MDRSRIDELAGGVKLSMGELASRIVQMKADGAQILDCIMYTKLNQGCSLAQACDIVINSAAWSAHRSEYLQHQEEMFQEFVADSSDQIESLHMTITPDGTDVVAHMKRKH